MNNNNDLETLALAAIKNKTKGGVNEPEETDTKNNCPDCGCVMENLGNEYCCPECGQVADKEEPEDPDGKDIGGCIKIFVDGRVERKLFGGSAANYSKNQKKQIHDILNARNDEAPVGKRISSEIVSAVANKFNEIQKLTVSKIENDGTISGSKKFVKRGSIRDEIIAALLFYECIKQGVARQHKEIAEFMKLETPGFSRGLSIIANLAGDKYIEIPNQVDTTKDFVRRYLKNLGKIPMEYEPVIIELVEKSEKMGIYINSNKSTKIVGAMWYIIQKLKLPVTHEDIEKSCDKIKKNTYMKFYSALVECGE